MEVEELQTQEQQPPCKFSRVGNNRNDSTKIGHPQDGEEENGRQLIKRPDYPITLAGGGNEDIDMNNNSITSINRLCGWHHSSRIIRVSRASGGKDRHSKVWTSKGLRDRRVRLSVTTAIQFYDLQDRLGYDQPSKAVEWLIKAAADAIAELPSLNSSFPPGDTSPSHHQLGGGQKRREHLEAALDSVEADVDNVEQGFSRGQSQSQNQRQEQHGSLSKSASSSTSETSKGSGLSLSRGDPKGNRVKARERARERTAKEKEKEKESDSSRVNNVHQQQHNLQNVSPMSQNSTFTELLTAGIGNNNHSGGGGSRGGGSPNAASSESNLFHTAAAAARQWPLTPLDYLSSGILSGTPTVGRSGFSGQTQLGNSMPQGMTMSPLVPQTATPFSVSIGGGGESHNNSNHHQLEQLQHFPFAADHLILPVSAAGGGSGVDYNLNFTISSSSGLAAGFNRGTLQSNSSSSTSSPQLSLLTHLQRFSATATGASANSSSAMDGSTTNVPFFIGAATTTMENHYNHQQQQFPPGLQLLYGEGSRHSGHKGKGKS